MFTYDACIHTCPRCECTHMSSMRENTRPRCVFSHILDPCINTSSMRVCTCPRCVYVYMCVYTSSMRVYTHVLDVCIHTCSRCLYAHMSWCVIHTYLRWMYTHVSSICCNMPSWVTDHNLFFTLHNVNVMRWESQEVVANNLLTSEVFRATYFCRGFAIIQPKSQKSFYRHVAFPT